MMTILDRPEDLALGYLLNQNMLQRDDARDRRRVRRRPAASWWCGPSARPISREAEEEDADLRLRPGHRLRRPDGGFRGEAPSGGGAADVLAVPAAAPDQHLADASTWRPARSMAARSASRTGRWSTWRMSAATTRWTRSRAGCSAHATPRRQDLLHHRPPDLGDGHQDRADGHPDPGLAVRLHRLGGGAGARGGADPDRPLQGQALPRARRRGAHRLRRRPRHVRRRARSTGGRTARRCGRRMRP